MFIMLQKILRLKIRVVFLHKSSKKFNVLSLQNVTVKETAGSEREKN